MTANWTPARLGDLTGKRIMVTGATNGVGLGTARALTRAGAHVIMAVRNTELGAQRAKEIGGSTSIIKVDLADLSSVHAFADALDGDVDILINNAGMLTQDARRNRRRVREDDRHEPARALRVDEPDLPQGALADHQRGIARASKRQAPARRYASAHRQVDDDGFLRALQARGDAMGTRTGSQAARREFACRQPTHASRLGRLEPVERLRQAGAGRRRQSGTQGGQCGRQRYRRRRRVDPVLHQRTDPTGQLHRLRRSVRACRVRW